MKTSLHDLSRTRMMSANMGQLIPIDWEEVLPGDHFQHDTTLLIRTQPLLAPLMHRVHAKVFHFFVPNRLLWTNWEPFITGGEDGENASVHPFVNVLGTTPVGSLYDYLELVPDVGSVRQVNALIPRAYAKICRDYFTDQDLVTPPPLALTDGLDNTTNADIFSPAWKKDYYTVARPQPSKGPDVTAPVIGAEPTIGSDGTPPNFTGSGVTNVTMRINNAAGNNAVTGNTTGANNTGSIAFGTNTGLEIQEGSLSVNALDLREMFATLRFQELRSRFGSKYVDYLAYLGVKSDDARLQRSEYLGGGISPLQFSEVLQTAPEDAENPVGALKGHGISAKKSNRYRKYFQEHGILMTVMYVMPEPVYGQGFRKGWLRKTKEDYWQPEYEHIGQQVLQNQEVYAPSADPEGTFGWVDRYDEYRSTPSTVSGNFRPGESLDYWTMARGYATEPALNEDFVTGNPTTRIWPATNEQQLYIMMRRKLKARRKVTNNPKGYVY